MTSTSHGALTLNADGSFTYTPDADYSGTDSFTYRANDGTSDSNLATVTIEVAPDNDAPVAGADSYSVQQDATLSVPASGVLANDSDDDGDLLTAAAWSGISNHGGQVVLNSNGSFTYTPPAGFSGTDTFSYSASDSNLSSNLATVSIEVQAHSQDTLYVYDIDFDSRKGGSEWRAVFQIRSDSNADGHGDAADARASNTAITVTFAGRTYSGTTDSNGIFRTGWIRGLSGGAHYANAVDLALEGYTWDPLALDLEDDSNNDGKPDAILWR